MERRICGIADDALRDLHVGGKDRDVILPMIVISHLNVVLESIEPAMREMRALLVTAGGTYQKYGLCRAAGLAFYHTWTFPLLETLLPEPISEDHWIRPRGIIEEAGR